MLTDDLFLARASCFPQVSLVSSVGSLTRLHHGIVGLCAETCRLLFLSVCCSRFQRNQGSSAAHNRRQVVRRRNLAAGSSGLAVHHCQDWNFGPGGPPEAPKY